jgi:hypothetical protein
MAGPESSAKAVKLGNLDGLSITSLIDAELRVDHRRMPPGDAPGPIPGLVGPFMPMVPGAELNAGVFVLGVSNGWSRGTSGGAVYMCAGGVGNSSSLRCRISRFGVLAQPLHPTTAAATVNQTAFIAWPLSSRNRADNTGGRARVKPRRVTWWCLR